MVRVARPAPVVDGPGLVAGIGFSRRGGPVRSVDRRPRRGSEVACQLAGQLAACRKIGAMVGANRVESDRIARGRAALKALQAQPPASARREKRDSVLQLIEEIEKCQAAGVTLPQIREALRAANIVVGERTIRRALDEHRDRKVGR